jgi:SAM-dependent methyltransferase
VPEADPIQLVEKAFWEQDYYWSEAELPCRPDPHLPFDRALGAALLELADVGPEESAIEIGCAPAKWLVHLAERTGARVEGIEYSEQGAQLSTANLRACGIEGTIYQADFFMHQISGYDLVLSLGFIEHFEELDEVFARHAAFVAPSGRLLLGVPNFRGLNGFLQRHSDPSYLALHNLRAMDSAELRRLGDRNGLQVLDQRYLGGTDAVIVKPGPLWVKGIVLAEGRLRRLRLAERINHRWFAPYLLTTYVKPRDESPRDSRSDASPRPSGR